MWNPYVAAGAPHLANSQSAPLDPLLAPVHAFGTIRAWDLSLLLAYALALVFAFMLGQALGLGAVGAVVCSVGFGLSGFVFVYGNNHWARPYLYIPLLLMAIEWGVHGRRVRGWVVSAVGVALMALAGMPEVTAIVALVAGVYLVSRLAFVSGWRERLVLTGWWSSAAAVGLLIAMPTLLPLFEYLAVAHTKHGADSGAALQRMQFRRLVNLGIPYLGGYPRSSGGSASANTADWTGISVILLSSIGFAGKRTSIRPAQWASLISFAVLAGIVYDFTYLNWTAHLPGFERILFVRFGHPAVVIPIVVLAGFGIRRIADGKVDLRRAAILVTGVVMLLTWSWYQGRQTTSLAGLAHNARWLLLAVAAAASTISATILTALRPSTRRLAGALCVLVVCGEMLMLAPGNIYPRRADSFAEPAWLALIRERSTPQLTDRYYGDAAKLAAGTSTAMGLQDVRVLDAIVVERYWNMIQGFVEPEFTGTHFGRGHTTPPRIEGNPMADLLGVRYHLTDSPLGPSELSSGTRFLGVAGGTYVYERESRLPRAFTVPFVTVVADEPAAHEVLAQMGLRQADGMVLLDRWDPSILAIVEATDDDATALSELTDDSACGDSTTMITRYDAHHVDVVVDTDCTQLLVLSDTYYPGWKASLNGEMTKILPANVAFRSVVVPPGRSTVTFEYVSAPFRLGLILSALGLLILIAVPISSRAQRRGGLWRSV